MKNKGIKIVLIVVLSIISIVLISLMIFLLINKDKDFKISLIGFGNNTELIFEKEYDPEQLDSINVNVSSSDVKIEKVDSDKIKIIAYGSKNDKIKEAVSDKELFVDKENTRIFIFSIFYWCKEEIIIQIPNNSDEVFKIHTTSGNIISSDLDINNVQFSTSSGEIECGNIYNGEIKSSSGNIKVGNIGEGILKTSSGKIIVESAKKLKLETSSGDIAIKNIESSCELSAGSGNIVVERLNITQNSYIDIKSGNVIINGKNDIYVEAQTRSGNVNVQNNNRKADIELKITTTSGNIKVK